MGRTVRKLFIFDDSWNIGRLESWFSDMAARGLHLKDINRIFVSFEKGEPKKTEYRIDVLYEEPSQEQIDVYKECGWSLVAAIPSNFFYIFSSSGNSDFPELHTDPVEQGQTLTRLNKRLSMYTVSTLFLFVIYLIMMYFVFFVDSKPFLSMVEGDFLVQILSALVLTYSVFVVLRNYAAVRNLRKTLLTGVPLNHRQNWRRSRLINVSFFILTIIIAVFTIVNPFIEISKRKNYTFTENTGNIPVVRLADIEQDPELQRSVGVINGIDWLNSVSYSWSVLAPVQYKVEEHGFIETEKGKSDKSVSTIFYDVAFDFMATGLVDDLMNKYMYDTQIKPERINDTRFDNLHIFNTDDYNIRIFGSRGRAVFYINYYGHKDADHIVSLLADVMRNYDHD